jgi:AraC-like DNA-binding protein
VGLELTPQPGLMPSEPFRLQNEWYKGECHISTYAFLGCHVGPDHGLCYPRAVIRNAKRGSCSGSRVATEIGALWFTVIRLGPRWGHAPPLDPCTRPSRELRVGRRTIQAGIRVTTGKTFRKFREEILLARVNSFFASRPGLAIKELSFEVGYACPQSFARAVKRASGMSPEELRSVIVNAALVRQNSDRRASLVVTAFPRFRSRISPAADAQST